MPQSFAQDLRHREKTGSGRSAAHAFSSNRAQSLGFSQRKVVASHQEGAILQLSLDPVESRYLLSGSADSTVAVFDTTATDIKDTQKETCPAVLKVSRSNSSCHKYSVSCVTWYPIDSGLFVSGSLDGDAKVWDTNTAQAACTFPFGEKVQAVAMSPIATSHCLLAVSGGKPQITLCDPASGSFTAVLGGQGQFGGSHREDVWALHWSLQHEWHLATGGCDGQVRLWDLRRCACFHTFDVQQTSKQSAQALSSPRRHARARSSTGRSGPPRVSVAHEGSVTAILPTSDGRHWLTAGTDSRLLLWDTVDFRHLLVNYRNTYNRASKARQIAASVDGQVLFHPSGSVIQVLDMSSGEQHKLLRGHLDTINACVFNPVSQELYTGADDASIILWSHEDPSALAELENEDKDAWSD